MIKVNIMSSDADHKESGKRKFDELTAENAFHVLQTWHRISPGTIHADLIEHGYCGVPTQQALISILGINADQDAKHNPRECSKCGNADVNTIVLHGCARMHRLCRAACWTHQQAATEIKCETIGLFFCDKGPFCKT